MEAEPGILSVQAAEETVNITVTGRPNHPSVDEDNPCVNEEGGNEQMLDQMAAGESPQRVAASQSNEALQRTPPNTWQPSLEAPGAPKKQRPQGRRPRRPTPYDVRIAEHDQREVGPVLRVEDQPSALTNYFGNERVQAMISMSSMGAHSFMTEMENETAGPEWTPSDDDDEELL